MLLSVFWAPCSIRHTRWNHPFPLWIVLFQYRQAERSREEKCCIDYRYIRDLYHRNACMLHKLPSFLHLLKIYFIFICIFCRIVSLRAVEAIHDVFGFNCIISSISSSQWHRATFLLYSMAGRDKRDKMGCSVVQEVHSSRWKWREHAKAVTVPGIFKFEICLKDCDFLQIPSATTVPLECPSRGQQHVPCSWPWRRASLRICLAP